MFVISKDTQDFINREGNNITIYLRALTPGEGWRPTRDNILIPAVRLGKPHSRQINNFTTHLVDGITVWKADNIEPEADDIPITIEVKKKLFLYKFTIDGVKLIVDTNVC